MKKAVAILLLCGLVSCQSAPTRAPAPSLPPADGAQTVTIAASPDLVRNTLIASAQQKGTPVIQNEANMVVMERRMDGENPALDKEFGPSDHGNRVIRIRIRFAGAACRTDVVQDLAIINNVRTALEKSYVLPGNANTMQSLQGLKQSAEQVSTCPAF